MKLKWMMVSLMVACMAVFGEQYEDRWFYVSRLLTLRKDKEQSFDGDESDLLLPENLRNRN